MRAGAASAGSADAAPTRPALMRAPCVAAFRFRASQTAALAVDNHREDARDVLVRRVHRHVAPLGVDPQDLPRQFTAFHA